MSTETTPPAPAFVSARRFAELSGLPIWHVRKMLKSGELAHIVVNGRGDRRIPVSEVDRLVEQAQEAVIQPRGRTTVVTDPQEGT